MTNIRYMYRGKVSVGYYSTGQFVCVAFLRRNKGDQHCKATARRLLDQKFNDGDFFMYRDSDKQSLSVQNVLEAISQFVYENDENSFENNSQNEDLLNFIYSFNYNLSGHFKDIFYPNIDALKAYVPEQSNVSEIKKVEEYPYMIGDNRVRFFHDQVTGYSVGFYQTMNSIRYTFSVCSEDDIKRFNKKIARENITFMLDNDFCVLLPKRREADEIMSYGEVLYEIYANFHQVRDFHPVMKKWRRKRRNEILHSMEDNFAV